jgi:glycogen(starch) synthase
MRIFMLGWEFPPFIAGGLGTACHGLTKGLVNHGHEVLFVLPQAAPDGYQTHVQLLGPHTLRAKAAEVRHRVATGQPVLRPTHAGHQHDPSEPEIIDAPPGAARASAPATPTGLAPTDDAPGVSAHPYPGVDYADTLNRVIDQLAATVAPASPGTRADRFAAFRSSSATELAAAMDQVLGSFDQMGTHGGGYGGDLFGDAQRFAGLACALGVHERFDVIHAHDWLTYPAGLALRALTGKPLVVHIHATEFDRSGEHVNQGVYDIERAGMARGRPRHRGVPPDQVHRPPPLRRAGEPDRGRLQRRRPGLGQQPKQGMAIERDDKIVLFLGRITMQKGPEYFIRAASRVLEKYDNVKFVVAGSGDMAVKMIEEAASYGIGHKVLFTGFLRGRDVDRVFRMADCYVMPSVSEPFGIAPLEAMRNDVPVIVSKQSGVSEVLTHCLKVDFWDTDEMANKIVAVLRYPPLSQTLREHGRFELRGLNWDGAAEKCVKAYARAIASKA